MIFRRALSKLTILTQFGASVQLSSVCLGALILDDNSAVVDASFLHHLELMRHLKRFEIVSIQGSFSSFGGKLFQKLGALKDLKYVRIGFGMVSEVEMEEILCTGCMDWSSSRFVFLTLVPKLGSGGEKWPVEGTDQLQDKAHELGAHLQFVWQ